MVNKLALLPFFLVVLPLIIFIVFVQLEHWTTLTIPNTALGMITNRSTDENNQNEDSVSTGSIVFVGDVLLARNVEFLMSTKGVNYPFLHVPELFGLHNSAIIGNFESAILEQHKKTPSFVTTFSVDKNILPEVQKVGFTHMSLANNHSLDYGSTTFAHTRLALEQVGITPFGHPAHVDGVSHVVVRTGATRVGVLAINQINSLQSKEEINTGLALLASTTDFQIVYIHWGDEYMLKHNSTQEVLAKQLIDAGADTIIGHHPHVVQDIDVYKDKPIFYSLGNFIFDQYFSVDVQQGLLLKLSFINSEVQYELTPVSSESTNSQPTFMTADAQSLFLANLARRSNPDYAENIKQGKLILPFSLATYE